ncbi:MAG: hypothetical protein O0V67_08180 [Methanocorpusculum sp.]|nr:hypothetical protein [Methanocorpusculum sp.]
MKQLRPFVLIVTVLVCCSLIPAATAWEPVPLKDSSFFPDAHISPTYYPVAWSLPKETVIHGPDTKYYKYTLDPGSTELDVTLQWNSPKEHNPLKLQITAPNGETFGPCNDENKNGKIHKLLSSPVLPPGDWIISVTQTANETTSFTLIINGSQHENS